MTSARSRTRSSAPAARWNRRYREGGDLGEDPSPLLIRAVRARRPGVALELACGAGRNAIYLAKLGWRVTAVDVSRVAIDVLKDRSAAAGVEIDARVGDLESGSFPIAPNSYDLICDFYFLDRDLFPAIRRGIKPAGLFAGSIHLHDDSPDLKPMNPDYLLADGELRRYFSRWKILHYREGKPDDADHDRRCADIIARKPGP